MKLSLFVSALAFSTIGFSALAANASIDTFCVDPAIAAAKALANLNGTVSEDLSYVHTGDGLSFEIGLHDKPLIDGKYMKTDNYTVVTTGGHDCIVLSVTVKDTPTLRP